MTWNVVKFWNFEGLDCIVEQTLWYSETSRRVAWDLTFFFSKEDISVMENGVKILDEVGPAANARVTPHKWSKAQETI